MNYILYGELYPMIRKHLNKILKERLGEPDDFNVVKIDMEETSINEVIDEASMLPLGYEKKAVVVDNASFLQKDGKNEQKAAILELLKNSTEEITLIFILRNDKVEKNGEIYKFIQENGRVFEFLNIKKEEWPVYIRKYFKSKNVGITADAVNELAVRIDGDLSKFINEADKLCLYKDNIDIADIVLMVSKPLEDDAFQMSNALFRGDNGLAISIYRDLKLLGSKFVDTLIPMLASQFRFISEVCFLNSRGLSKSDIASQLGVNEFRISMALKNSRYLSRRQIAQVLDNLYNLDVQIKSGQIDRSYGLELFLINFPN